MLLRGEDLLSGISRLNTAEWSRIYGVDGWNEYREMERQVSPTLLQHLTSEISRISEEQTEALRMAGFVGMTEDEVREYQERRKRLSELVSEFAALTSQRLP